MPLITAALPNFLRRSSIARSAWAERRSSMSVSSACEPGAQRADAGAHQAEGGAVDLLRQHFAGDRKNLGRELRRRVNRLRAGALAEIGGLQFQRDGRAREIAVLQPRRDFLRQLPQHLFQRREIADVVLERGFAGNRLGAAVRHHAAVVDAARQPPQPAPLGSQTASSVRFRRRAANRRWCESRAGSAVPGSPGRRRR